MAYSPEKIQALENALRKTAELVGEFTETPNQDGVKTGLDLTNEALICNQAADAVKEGVFKVVVMGSFCTGKTSVINALSGSRILPDTVLPTTPVISYLRYGADDKKIHVYKNDKSVEEMSYEVFFNKYKFSNEDAEEARKTGMVKHFSDVEYSVVYSNMPLLKNGVQLLEAPGLEEKDNASKTISLTRDANAIIYVGNAISGGFNMNDQEFFKLNFEGRSLNNVFFIINKADLLDEVELDHVKRYHKTQLEEVFKNGKGVFDELLYTKRVFYVSAKFMLEQKTEQYSKRYEDTYTPEFERFEKELEELLTTDARSIATFNSYFALMANAYNTIDCIAGKTSSFENEIICIEKKIHYVENVVANFDNNFEIRKNQLLEIVDRSMAKLVDDIIGISYLEMKNIIVSTGHSISDIISTKWPKQYVINKERRTIEFEQKMGPVVQQIVKLLEYKFELVKAEFEQSIYPINQELTDTIQETEKLLNELGLQIHEARKKNKEGVLYNPVRLNPYNNIIYYITNPHSFHFDEIAWLLLKEWVNSFEGKKNTDESFNKSINEYLGISDIKSQLTGSVLQNFEYVTDSIDGFMKTQKQLFECIKENSIIAGDISQKDIQQNTTVLKEIWNCANEAYQIVFEKDISLEEFRKIGQ